MTAGKVEDQRKKVAVIGSGMAGLVTAYLLANDRRGRFDVEVLEMQDKLSLDSASYTLPASESESESAPVDGDDLRDVTNSNTISATENGERRRVDLPMRAFAAGYYDNLRKMYAYLGVEFEESRFVYTFSTLSSSSRNMGSGSTEKVGKEGGEGETYFIHSSNYHILPPLRPEGSSLLKWVVEMGYLLFWYAWFKAACFLIPPRLKSTSSRAEVGGDESLRSYLSRIKIPTAYTNRYFLPLMSAVATCTHDQLLDFPAIDLVGYARRTCRRPHYTVKGGVRQAEGRLSKGLNVRLGARVTSVEPTGSDKVRVTWTSRGKDAEEMEVYDHAVIAVTPDVVGAIFTPLRKKMALIPTTAVESIVHRDFSRIGLSRNRNCSSLCARLRTRLRQGRGSSSTSSESKIGIEIHSEPIHLFTDRGYTQTESVHEDPSSMLITTYPIDSSSVDAEKVLHRVKFTRVLRSVTSREVVNSIFDTHSPPRTRSNLGNGEDKDGWKNGDYNVFLVGGWCWDGMVLLEGCIVSAIRVADALGVDVPWR